MRKKMRKEKSSEKRKLTIIINGLSGVGKDTICDIVSRHYKSKSISSITPIKEIALQKGWDGKKDFRGRRFLSDLKRAYIEYNDLPNCYLEEEYQKFKESDEADILFVHIREPDQIRDFKYTIEQIGGNCITLLIRREPRSVSEMRYYSLFDPDDSVENYRYDFCYTNKFGIEEKGKEESLKRLEEDFLKFFHKITLENAYFESLKKT